MIFSKNTLTNIFVPVLLAAISGCIIFYKFPFIPQQISTDEVEFIQLAQTLENIPYTPYSQLATGHATLYFYILLASIKLFGATVFAVRFPSAFFGVIDVVLIYFVFKLIFERLDKLNSTFQIGFPVLMAFIFATMRWYFNFARFGFEASTVLFFELAGLLTFLQYLKYKSYGFLIGTGILAGLAYNSYTPGRLFFLLPIILLCFHFWENKTTKKKIVTQLLYVLIPFVICITPLNLYFTQHDDNRIYEQFFLQSKQLSVQEKSSFLWENVTKVSGMFLFQGDSNGRHNYPGKPMLNPFLGILFITGLIISILQWKKFHHKIFLLFFALGILPPLLTYPWENPNALRSVTALPSVVFFIGQSLLFITKISHYKKYVVYLLFILVGLSALYEIRTYFIFQAKVFPSSFEISPDLLPQYLDGTYPIRPDSTKKL